MIRRSCYYSHHANGCGCRDERAGIHYRTEPGPRTFGPSTLTHPARLGVDALSRSRLGVAAPPQVVTVLPRPRGRRAAGTRPRAPNFHQFKVKKLPLPEPLNLRRRSQNDPYRVDLGPRVTSLGFRLLRPFGTLREPSV